MAVSAARRNSRTQPAAVSPALRRKALRTKKRSKWSCTPATRWPRAAFTINSAAAFARYSVDAEWLVPHFEKMLYDNAQLVAALSRRLSGQRRRAPCAMSRAIFSDYVLRDMTHPGRRILFRRRCRQRRQGRQILLLDAKTKFEAALTPRNSKWPSAISASPSKGNFVDHSDPNPLARSKCIEHRRSETFRRRDSALLASAKEKMFDARAKRVRPHLDDKILASWNGMMLGAIARAYCCAGR